MRHQLVWRIKCLKGYHYFTILNIPSLSAITIFTYATVIGAVAKAYLLFVVIHEKFESVTL